MKICSFKNGPALGRNLMLARAPALLRVVRTAAGEWDALDRREDVPLVGEVVFVYVLTEVCGQVHLNMGRKKGSGTGWYWLVSYHLYLPQPAEADWRDTAPWRAWCLSQVQSPVLARAMHQRMHPTEAPHESK